MNRFKYIILFLLPLLPVSCAKDLGNYKYNDLDEPEISGIESEISVMTESRLSISPVLSGGKEDDSYTFEWKVTDRNNDNETTVIGTEKALDYKVVIPAGAYSLYYTVTETSSGIYWQKEATLTVNSLMSEGWMVLCDADGKTELNFISASTGDIYRDILKDKGLPELGVPRRIHWQNSMTDSSSPYYLLTDNGATRLGKNDFEWKEEFMLKYEMGSYADVSPYSIVSCGFGKMFVSGTDAHYCESMGISGLYSTSVNKDFRVAPEIGTNILANMIYAAIYLMYDIDNKRFIAYCPLLGTSDLGSQKTLGDLDEMGKIAEGMSSEGQESVVGDAFAEYPEGLEYVYMENTKYDPGNAKMGVTYTVLADGARRFVYGIQLGDFLRYADCPYMFGKAYYGDASGCTDITSAEHFAFSSLKNYMYYSTGGKVYMVNLSETPLTAQLQFELSGENITMLKFNQYKNSGNAKLSYDLVVGSEKNGKGSLRVYEGYESEGDFRNVTPEVFGNFNVIADATYKERLY